MTEKNRRDSEPGRPTAGRKQAHVDRRPESGGPMPDQPSEPAGPPATADSDEPTVVQGPVATGTPGGPLPADPPADPDPDGPTQLLRPPPADNLDDYDDLDDLDGPTRPLRLPPVDDVDDLGGPARPLPRTPVGDNDDLDDLGGPTRPLRLPPVNDLGDLADVDDLGGPTRPLRRPSVDDGNDLNDVDDLGGPARPPRRSPGDDLDELDDRSRSLRLPSGDEDDDLGGRARPLRRPPVGDLDDVDDLGGPTRPLWQPSAGDLDSSADLAQQPPVDDLDGPTRRIWPRAAERTPADPATDSAPADPGPADPAPADPALSGPVAGRSSGPEPAGPEPLPPSLDQVNADGAPGVPEGDLDRKTAGARAGAGLAPWRRLSSAGALIWVLLALFGFTLVVQLRSNDGDQGLATARQEDLVRILSDLEARDSRLQSEINALELSQRQLTSGVAGRQAALEEADKRAGELGLLAGTLPGRGRGLRIVMSKVKASAVLNAVQELRGAGAEVMQVTGLNGTAVRIVASSYFVDADGGGLVVDGVRLSGPYTLDVIGSPQTMQPALQIHGGVVESVNSGGGSVTMEQRSLVEVTALHKATTLQYARPVS